MRVARSIVALVAMFALAGCAGMPFFGSGAPKGAVPMQPQSAPAPQASGPQSACLVLALPSGGPVGPVADKIRAGAVAAQQELGKHGVKIDLRHINTEQADWLTQLAALPPQCAVVGGPVQVPVFTAAKSAFARRHFFAFLPQVGEVEGHSAWRFFPSPQDQVAALVRFARGDLDITSYAALYPADTYGTRMTGIFEQAVRAAGGTVQTAGYNPAEMQNWPKTAAGLLQPREVNKVPVPSTNFGAIFLPDSWKNMDMVTASLLLSGEDRMVLMGTSLWEQSLSGVSTVNVHNYSLAVFPGAWNPAHVPPALQALPAKDFWTALGYDFVRFGSMLGLQGPVAAAEVNTRIQRAQGMTWAMAPMHWSPQGVASQQLFLFTPTQNGFTLLDVPAFKERRTQVLSRFDARGKAAATGQPVPALATPATLPGAAPVLAPAVIPKPSRAPSLPGT